MPSYWLLKSEPNCYNYDQLEQDQRTVWDGVTNNGALIHIRAMRKGDKALIYHSGGVRAAIGVAEVLTDPYADPALDNAKLVVVDVAPVRRLPRQVTLDEMKAEPSFEGSTMLRQGRLSIVPLTEAQWASIMALAGDLTPAPSP